MIARAIPYIGKESTGSVEGDADAVGDAIAGLVEDLGHKSTLTQVSCSSECMGLLLMRELVSCSTRRGSFDCITRIGEG
jgi:hypothetical protein